MSKALTVKELYDALAKLMKENPGCAELDVIVKVEIENENGYSDGSSLYEKVYAGNVEPGNWENEKRDFDYIFITKKEWVDEDGAYEENAICINH
jgi:hypothetical protein